MEHPAIKHLEGTPDTLRYLMSGLSEDEANWKPAPDRWSVAEVLEHLSHIEGHMFRHRLDLIVSSDQPTVEGYDQNVFAAAGTYSGRDAEDSFAHWEEQREDNIERLRDLEQSALKRRAIHAEVGPFTVEEMLNAWAFHDLGHIRQMAELVRAQMYLPAMGPFRAEYNVHP